MSYSQRMISSWQKLNPVMLSETCAKQHSIILPPSQKVPFWGGEHFLNNFMNFWFWANKKILVRISSKPELLICLSADSGQSMIFCNCKKTRDFQHFWANLVTFFFKMRFWAKLVLELLKMSFLRLFRS